MIPAEGALDYHLMLAGMPSNPLGAAKAARGRLPTCAAAEPGEAVPPSVSGCGWTSWRKSPSRHEIALGRSCGDAQCVESGAAPLSSKRRPPDLDAIGLLQKVRSTRHVQINGKSW